MTPVSLVEEPAKAIRQWDPHVIAVCGDCDIMITQSQSTSPVRLHENKMITSSHLRTR